MFLNAMFLQYNGQLDFFKNCTNFIGKKEMQKW